MRILVSDPLADEAVDVLKEHAEVDVRQVSPEELLKIIPGYDALLVRSATKVTKAVLEVGTNLKVVGRAGVGVDNIDVETAKKKGVAVVNAPLAASNAVAELVLAHMLGLARHIPRANHGMHAGEWEKKALKGTELKGKTLGLIGVGRIGGRVAELAGAFGMDVIFHDPYVTKEREQELSATRAGSLDDLVARADYVSTHVPLTDETRNLVNADLIGKMKNTAVVMNLSRGGVVDEDALAKALKDGKLGGAALDVFAEEPPKKLALAGLPNVSLTPHLGAATAEAQVNAGVTTAEQVMKVLKGESAEHRVA